VQLEAEVARLQSAATAHADETAQSAKNVAAAQVGHRLAELRYVEAAAREAFIRSILDANTDSSKVLDPQGRLEMLNVSSLSALEISNPAQLIGQPWADLWPEAARILVETALQGALQGRSSRFSAPRPTTTGTPKWWDVVINPIVDDQGAVTRILVTSRDITELHRIQTAAIEFNLDLQAQLEQALAGRDKAPNALDQIEKPQALGQLVGGVAHDFNNLLQVISGAAALLKKPSLEPARKDTLLDGIITAAQHAQTLTSRLLAFSHRNAPMPAAFDVNSRLSTMVELLQCTMTSQITVRTDFSENVCPVEADVSQFEIALLNLVVNARDAMPAGGTLTIRTSLAKRADGSFACIRVTDTGQGMAPEVKTRIFEPYYTTKGPGKGTGLGLPQVVDFIRIAGGHIEVESETGQGASFLLYLPCKKTADEPHV